MPAPDPIVIVRLDQIKLASGEAATFGAPPVGYACPTCGQIYTPQTWPAANKNTQEEREAEARRAASCCHYKHCEDCDEVIAPEHSPWTICKSCRAKREAAKEAARYAKTEKVQEDAYDGWVYWEDYGSQDGFFESVDELRSWAIDEDVELPEYVYACTTHKIPHLNADDIVSNALENEFAYEDAIDDMDIQCLQKLLDFWLQYNQRNCFQQDETHVVILSEEENRKYEEERAKELADWEAQEAERQRRTTPTIPPVPDTENHD
jgi:hypothetical protein